MAYVVQCVFHNLENYTQETPMAYVTWRFADNGDKENIEFMFLELSRAEEEMCDEVVH